MIFLKLHKIIKNSIFKLDKNLLEPRAKVKEFFKIQPKILDSFILENENTDLFSENPNNETKNSKNKNKSNISINLNNIETDDNNTIINDDNDFSEIINNGLNDITVVHNNKFYELMNEKLNEQYYFLTESDNIKNSLNNILDINEINLDYLIMIVKLYNELIKDIEINKMEIYQNKLSIVKDFLYIFSSENNSKLYNLIDDMILNDNNLILGNSTFDKNKSNKLNKNQNDNIFSILKEYFIIQIIFSYIIILISLIKKINIIIIQDCIT